MTSEGLPAVPILRQDQPHLSMDPVWLEPASHGPIPYDRRKAQMLFYSFLPSAEEKDWTESVDKLLHQLASLREPAGFEVVGCEGLFRCHWAVQERCRFTALGHRFGIPRRVPPRAVGRPPLQLLPRDQAGQVVAAVPLPRLLQRAAPLPASFQQRALCEG